MSILCLLPAALAVEFEVGAGAELMGHTAPGTLDVELRQAEIGGYLDFGVAAVRADFDIDGASRALAPEWAAVVADAGRWELGVGFQPLPAGTEHTDAWRNPFILYTQGMALHPGGMLGLRANRGLDAPVVPSVWGGVLSGVGQTIGDPVLGGGVQVGDVTALYARVSADVLPTRRTGSLHGGVEAPLGELFRLGGDVHGHLASGAASGTLSAHGVLLPDKLVAPVARVEWASAGVLAVDAGILAQLHESFRVLASGRVEGSEWGVYASVALVDEREQRDLWSLR